MENPPDTPLRYAKVSSKTALSTSGNRPPPNFLYLDIGQFRLAMILSTKRYMSSFPVAVPHIICVRPKKKMVRANTRWIVTKMTDIHPGRDFAVGESP